ncbi:MAG: efflux RND transporter periplasmic adaptor subunit [Verrucomicrobiota bacterium]
MNRFFVFLLGLAFFVAGCGEKQEEAPPPMPPVFVETQFSKQEEVVERIPSVGTLEADESVTIQPEVGGTVKTIDFTEGQKVSKGQVLIRLDDEKQQAQLKQTESSLQLAEVNFVRGQKLLEEKTISQQEFDQLCNQRSSSEAAVALEKKTLEDMTMEAPFDGVVGSRLVSQGQVINAGTPMTSLYATDPMKIIFSIPERLAGRVRVGQEVDLKVPAFTTGFKGEVFLIDPQVDVATRTVKIKARVPNPDDSLKPGMFADVNLVVERRENAVTVPEEAIFPYREKFAVYVVENNTAKLREVEIGLRLTGKVEIVKGLSAQEEVITLGTQKVKEGTAVTTGRNSSQESR